MLSKKDFTILYDGDCVLCNYWISTIKKNPNASRFQIISLEEWKRANDSNQFVSRNNWLEFPDSVVLNYNDQIYTESDAVLKIVAQLAGPIRLLLIGYVLPRFIRNLLYRWIAKNRYRWFGRRNNC